MIFVRFFEGLRKFGDGFLPKSFRPEKPVANHKGLVLSGIPCDVEEYRPFDDISERTDRGAEVALTPA